MRWAKYSPTITPTVTTATHPPPGPFIIIFPSARILLNHRDIHPACLSLCFGLSVRKRAMLLYLPSRFPFFFCLPVCVSGAFKTPLAISSLPSSLFPLLLFSQRSLYIFSGPSIVIFFNEIGSSFLLKWRSEWLVISGWVGHIFETFTLH